MDVLGLLRTQWREAEVDTAIWIDDQKLLRPIAGFLAHHRTTRAVAAVALGAALAPAATVAAIITAGRVIDRAHEIAGEDTAPCKTCVNAEADEFSADTETLTYEDVCNAWDLTDGGLL
jgi:hypothetical protein